MTTTIDEKTVDAEAIRTEAARAAEQLKVPGVQVVVVREGEVLFAGGAGRRDLGRDLPVTEHTVFAHGSTGKAFTACLIGTLVDEGRLRWDSKVRDLIPDFRLADPVATEMLTVRDLLTHRSGLPRHEFAHLAHPGLDRGEMVRRLRHLESSKEIRELFQYSNFGFLVAGHIVGLVTGSTFEEQLRRRILEPLGMADTVIGTEGIEAVADRALPYDEKDGELVPIAYRQMANMIPAGGLFASAADVTRWLLCQLGGGEAGGTRIVSEPSLKEMHSLQMAITSPLAAPLQGAPARSDGYGLGWMTGTYRGRRYVEHGGGIDGFTTSFALLPEERIGIGVCGNRASGLPIALVWQLLDRLLGAEPKDWTGVVQEQMEKMRAAVREQQAPKQVVEGTRPAHPLADYAGRYEHPGYGALEVTADGDALAVSLGAIRFRTAHRHYETWDLVFEDLGEIRFELGFQTDGSGDVSAAAVNFEPSVAAIRFRRAPDERASDEAYLNGLAGTYELGPVTVEVKVEPGPRLVAFQNGTRVELEPAAGLRYSVPAAPGLTLEFVLDESGRATAIATPQGTLTRRAG